MIRVKGIFKGASCGFIKGNQYTLDFSINELNRVAVVCGRRVCEYDSLKKFLDNFDVIQ